MPSNINPNNIDGAYPVAGQDNNSQGFRDNFTNTKTNFQFAENEINDLQNKVILKSALIGQSLNNDMAGALLEAARIQDFSATRFEQTTTSGTITVDYGSGHYQTVSTSANIALAFTGFPAAAYGLVKVQINITNTAHTVTLPATVTLGLTGLQGYDSGTRAITFDATGKYEFAFGSYNGGSEITIFDLSRGLVNFGGADLTVDDVTASGFVSAAGNVTGGNLITAGSTIVTGNITGGNVLSTGAISTTGNVTGGNITTSGQVTATGNIDGLNMRGYVRPTAGGTTTTAIPLLFTSGSLVNTPSQTLTGGAMEFDGAAIYAAFANNQRGVLGTEHFRCLTGDAALTNNASAQAVFPTTGSVTLAASTTYFVEALYLVGPGSGTNLNAVTMSTLFAVTSALTDVYYTVDSTVGLATAVNDTKRKLVTAPTASVVTDAAAGGDESYITVIIKGVLRTNAATTVTPQISFSGTPAASALRVLKSSYIRLQPVGTSSVASVGLWS